VRETGTFSSRLIGGIGIKKVLLGATGTVVHAPRGP